MHWWESLKALESYWKISALTKASGEDGSDGTWYGHYRLFAPDIWFRPQVCVNPKIVQNEKCNPRAVAETPLAAKEQELEGLSRAAAEAAVHFPLEHLSGLLLSENTLTIEYSSNQCTLFIHGWG
jgi:hypothetical protein